MYTRERQHHQQQQPATTAISITKIYRDRARIGWKCKSTKQQQAKQQTFPLYTTFSLLILRMDGKNMSLCIYYVELQNEEFVRSRSVYKYNTITCIRAHMLQRTCILLAIIFSMSLVLSFCLASAFASLVRTVPLSLSRFLCMVVKNLFVRHFFLCVPTCCFYSKIF